MDLAEDCQEDFEAAENGCGENGITSDAHVDSTCGGFFGHGESRFFKVILFFFFFLGGGGGGGGGGGRELRGLLCHTYHYELRQSSGWDRSAR